MWDERLQKFFSCANNIVTYNRIYPDSIVHRFGREKGFNTIENDKKKDPYLLSVMKEYNCIQTRVRSELDRVENQGNFECFVLHVLPSCEYAHF